MQGHECLLASVIERCAFVVRTAVDVGPQPDAFDPAFHAQCLSGQRTGFGNRILQCFEPVFGTFARRIGILARTPQNIDQQASDLELVAIVVSAEWIDEP